MRLAIAASVVLAACLYAERSATQTSTGSARKTRSEKYLQACLDGSPYVDPDTGYRFECDESQLDAEQLRALRAKRRTTRPGVRARNPEPQADPVQAAAELTREPNKKAPIEKVEPAAAEQRGASAVEPATPTPEPARIHTPSRKIVPTRPAVAADSPKQGEKHPLCKVTFRPNLLAFTGTKTYSPQGPVSLRRNIYFFQDHSGSPVSLPAERTTVEGCGIDAPTPAAQGTRSGGANDSPDRMADVNE